jgi:hypothetical protein
MVDTPEHTYEFEDRANSYFQGSDVHCTRDDGKTVVINGKDGHCAVYVKDRKGSYVPDLPEDVRPLAEDLNRANKSRVGDYPFPDAEWTDVLYERAREQWWHDAEWLAREHDFDDVFSAGRSGGWCIIVPTNCDWHPSWIMHPDEQPAHEVDEAQEFQQRFLALAFDLVDMIEQAREQWAEQIREDHAALERERTESIVLGEN